VTCLMRICPRWLWLLSHHFPTRNSHRLSSILNRHELVHMVSSCPSCSSCQTFFLVVVLIFSFMWTLDNEVSTLATIIAHPFRSCLFFPISLEGLLLLIYLLIFFMNRVISSSSYYFSSSSSSTPLVLSIMIYFFLLLLLALRAMSYFLEVEMPL
jgi:hypothetical protein